MKEAPSPTSTTDEQYRAEVESLLAQMRLLNEQSEGHWERIEQLRAESQETLARMEAT